MHAHIAKSIGTFILLSWFVLCITGCHPTKTQHEHKLLAPSKLELSVVDITYVTAAPLNTWLPVSGVLSSKRKITIKSRLAGELIAMPIQEGQSISAGTLIARLDTGDAQAATVEKRAMVASADAELAEASRTRETQHRLLEAGFVSQAAYDAVEAKLHAKQSAKLAALAQLSIAEATLKRTEIRSTSPGVVYQLHTSAGEYAAPGTPIVTLMDPSMLQMIVSVPAIDILRVRPGNECRLIVIGGGEVVGKVARVSPAPEYGTRAFSVYIDVNNLDGHLRIGLYAHGQLATNEPKGPSILASKAIRHDNVGDFVLTIENGLIKRHTIVVRARDESLSRADIESSFDAAIPVVLTEDDRVQEGREVILVDHLR